MCTRAANHIYDVMLNPLFHLYLSHHRAATRYRVRIGKGMYIDSVQTASIESCIPIRNDVVLCFHRWIRKYDLKEKSIELGFRQRISAFVFDWILSRKHREQWRQLMQIAVDRCLTFFHCFQKSRLCFWWSAIDLIC